MHTVRYYRQWQDKKVIIRTLDIGADKKVDYFGLGEEENPAMGYRAIRICLKQPEIFKTQLRALLRAAVYGNLSVMYPMITSAEEVAQNSENCRRSSKQNWTEAESSISDSGAGYYDRDTGSSYDQ